MNDEMLTLDDILHLHTHCLICDCHLSSDFEQEQGYCLDCFREVERIARLRDKPRRRAIEARFLLKIRRFIRHKVFDI